MTEPLTREEHEARAMLLGRWYDPRDGTYVLDNHTPANDMLDCVTLEVIAYEDARARMGPDGYNGLIIDNMPTMPWEKEAHS